MAELVRTVVSIAVVGGGVVVLALGVIGLLRLPDVYTRAHAVAKAETLGLALVVIGLLVHPLTTWSVAVRLAAILAFALVANPTATHALTRAAYGSGVEPQRGDPANVATDTGGERA